MNILDDLEVTANRYYNIVFCFVMEGLHDFQYIFAVYIYRQHILGNLEVIVNIY